MNMEVGMHNYMYLLTYLHKYAKNASPYRCEVLDIGQVCTYVSTYIHTYMAYRHLSPYIQICIYAMPYVY